MNTLLEQCQYEKALKALLNDTITLIPVVYADSKHFQISNDIAYIGSFSNNGGVDIVDDIYNNSDIVSNNDVILFTKVNNSDFALFQGYKITSRQSLYSSTGR